MQVIIVVTSGILAGYPADFYGVLQSLQANSGLIFLFTYLFVVYLAMLSVAQTIKKVKVTRYTSWRCMGGEEV
jgi:uncharacterized membrane protein